MVAEEKKAMAGVFKNEKKFRVRATTLRLPPGVRDICRGNVATVIPDGVDVVVSRLSAGRSLRDHGGTSA